GDKVQRIRGPNRDGSFVDRDTGQVQKVLGFIRSRIPRCTRGHGGREIAEWLVSGRQHWTAVFQDRMTRSGSREKGDKIVARNVRYGKQGGIVINRDQDVRHLSGRVIEIDGEATALLIRARSAQRLAWPVGRGGHPDNVIVGSRG